MVDALDFSSFTAIPTPIQVECAKRNGVRKVIIGTRGNAAKFQNQALSWLAGGVEVEAFIYLYWAENGEAQAQRALGVIGSIPVTRIWPDVEEDRSPEVNNPYLSPAGTKRVLDDCIARLGDKCDGLYTSQEMWRRAGLGTGYSHLKLWTANYGPLPRPFRPYGGWTASTMTQYRGTATLCDLNVDWNTIDQEDCVNCYTKEETDDKIGELLNAILGIQKQLDNPNPVPPETAGLKQDIQNTFALALRNQGRIDKLEHP